MQSPPHTDEIFVVNTDDARDTDYGDGLNLFQNREISSQRAYNNNTPLVSLFFLAYNNLEKYTKPAIEALLKYTSHIDMELILIDNGSTDGTLEYFKSVKFRRKRICHVTKNCGAINGNLAATSSLGITGWGKYFVSVPNDILVTQNWLDNLIRCIESDESIGLVVPYSNSASNYQEVDLHYTDAEDMQIKAAAFNMSDPTKWEERVRAMPTVLLVRSSLIRTYVADPAFIYYFADDDMSFQYRRLGYKLIVCGDTFVYHAGSLGYANPEIYNASLVKGREIFRRKYYGIDAWLDTMDQNRLLAPLVTKSFLNDNHNKERVYHILGVDVQCGQPLLSVKNCLRRSGVDKTQLFAYTEDAKYWLDLKTVCDGEVACKSKLNAKFFDIIIMGEHLNKYSSLKGSLGRLIPKMKIWGRLVFSYINYPVEGYASMNFQTIDEFLLVFPNCRIQEITASLTKNQYLRNTWETLRMKANKGDVMASDQMKTWFADSCRFGQYFVGEITVVIERIQ